MDGDSNPPVIRPQSVLGCVSLRQGQTVRTVTTDDLAVKFVYILWRGDLFLPERLRRFHGVFAAKNEAIEASPDSEPLWVPSAVLPHDAWIQYGTVFFVQRYRLGSGE